MSEWQIEQTVPNPRGGLIFLSNEIQIRMMYQVPPVGLGGDWTWLAVRMSRDPPEWYPVKCGTLFFIGGGWFIGRWPATFHFGAYRLVTQLSVAKFTASVEGRAPFCESVGSPVSLPGAKESPVDLIASVKMNGRATIDRHLVTLHWRLVTNVLSFSNFSFYCHRRQILWSHVSPISFSTASFHCPCFSTLTLIASTLIQLNLITFLKNYYDHQQTLRNKI